MHLYLIRHGESEGNAAQRIQGRLDFPLTALGQSQARQVGAFLARTVPDLTHLYASPLARALVTAETIADAYPRPLTISTHDPLREIHAGRIEGQTWEALGAIEPPFLGRPRAQWLDFAPWGGMNQASFFAEVHTWCDAQFGAIPRDMEGTIAIVSHAITLRAILAWALDDRTHSQLQYYFTNGTIVRCSIRVHHQALQRTIDWLLPIDLLAAP